MNMYEFNQAVVGAIEDMIPIPLKEDFDVSVREVIKNNDEVLHGVTIMMSGRNVAPTVYLEECYVDYLEGIPVDEIAHDIISVSVEAYKTAPKIEDIPLNYEAVQNKLVVQLVDAEKNKARLKDLVYAGVGNGFVIIPYVVIREDADGSMRAAVTKSMAEEFNYNIEQVMDTALLNTVELYQPTFTGISSMMTIGNMGNQDNPMRADFVIDPDLGMYVLTNRVSTNGASALYYPGMKERIGELLGKNYYVLPSSIHEQIIVPEGTGPSLKDLQIMVKEANNTVVEPRDVLSDKVLFYDRERNRLIEPKIKERDGEERGDR